jgi:hypothetical protein
LAASIWYSYSIPRIWFCITRINLLLNTISYQIIMRKS